MQNFDPSRGSSSILERRKLQKEPKMRAFLLKFKLLMNIKISGETPLKQPHQNLLRRFLMMLKTMELF